MPWALEAQRLLAEEWGVAADVWSATSWTELRREALACEERNLLHPDGEQRTPYVTRALDGAAGPFVAVSDWMQAVPDQIARWVPGPFRSLGTDGFGLSDTRGATRRHLPRRRAVGGRSPCSPSSPRAARSSTTLVQQAIDRYQLLDVTAADAGNTGGEA